MKIDKRLREALRALGAIGGRKGGSAGGKLRMAALTPDERRELAQKAARARWAKHGRAT